MRTKIYLSLLVLWCAPGMAWGMEGNGHLWTFDESEGISADDAIGDRAGDVYGATRTDGQMGGGLRFDGADDYVALPDNDPAWLPVNEFTIAFWVRFERDKGSSTDENEVLVDFNAGSGRDPEDELGYIVFRHGEHGTLAFQMTTMQNTDEDLESKLVPARDKWYHVAAVRQGTLQKIYIDGRVDAWRACSASQIDFVGGYDDDKVNVGRYTTIAGAPRYHFKGMLDELVLLDRALSSAEIRRIYQEAPASHALYVDGAHGSDQNDGRRSLTALATIQNAVDLAKDGDVVNVGPGVYEEEVRFLGKAITVQSIADAAVIEAPEGFGVSFYMGEGSGTVLRNVVIANSYVGIFCVHSSPTIANVTVTGNVYGAEAYGSTVAFQYGGHGAPGITNSILWGNIESDLAGFSDSYCCVGKRNTGYPESPIFRSFVSGLTGDPCDIRDLGSLWPNPRGLSSDPLFVDPENGDYHLRSERGRYWPEHDIWVLDDVTSPCIDAGDPAAGFSGEPGPNGNRLNIGAHGGTAYAEMSDPPFAGDVNDDGVFDTKDYDLFMELWQQLTNPRPPAASRR